MKPAMDAARKGSATKMRRSAPIFQTVRQASPNDGGDSTGTSTVVGPSARGTDSPRSEASICSVSSSCSWVPRGGSRKRSPMITTTMIGMAKTMKGVRHDESAARPAPMSTPAMAPMLMPERWAE